MYIVFIALLYIWVMMLVTATSWLSGIAAFILGGMMLAVIYYLLDTSGRKKRRLAAEKQETEPSADKAA
ncbi:MAG TPA: hypothetical protein VFN66_10820 [Burkholderiales bacterium]|nr:hypothetical protein [Burkholderiales bacterium]